MEDRSKARDPGPSTSTSWPLASGPSSWPTCFLGSKSKNGPQENCQFVAHFVHLPSQRVPHQCIPSIWGSGGVSSHLVLGFAAQPLGPAQLAAPGFTRSRASDPGQCTPSAPEVPDRGCTSHYLRGKQKPGCLQVLCRLRSQATQHASVFSARPTSSPGTHRCDSAP